MKTSVQLGKGVEQLFGKFDENLKLLERSFDVSLHLSAEALEIEGADSNVRRATRLVEEYSELVEGGTRFEHTDVQSFLRILSEDPNATLNGLTEKPEPASLCGRDRAARHGFRHRTLGHWQDLPRRGDGGGRSTDQGSEPDYSGAPGGRGRRAARLSARNAAGKGESVPAPPL